jgi:protein-S-isoprenylcysteine O-methyltransferase Ste14
MEGAFHTTLLRLWSFLALAVFVALFFLPAPYGRHRRQGWGPTVHATWGWVWMELAAVLTMPVLFLMSDRRDPISWCWLILWEVHYLHRTFVFPFRRSRPTHRTPWAVVAMGATFNLVNGYLIGRHLFTLGTEYPPSWWARWPFLIGFSLFLGGMALNIDSDRRLLKLSESVGGYAIPDGGAFRWISCPNYLGEIIEWAGWALATLSPAGLVFAWWTLANLAPRAWTHHLWYRDRFPDYPAERRALLPYVW